MSGCLSGNPFHKHLPATIRRPYNALSGKQPKTDRNKDSRQPP